MPDRPRFGTYIDRLPDVILRGYCTLQFALVTELPEPRRPNTHMRAVCGKGQRSPSTFHEDSGCAFGFRPVLS